MEMANEKWSQMKEETEIGRSKEMEQEERKRSKELEKWKWKQAGRRREDGAKIQGGIEARRREEQDIRACITRIERHTPTHIK